MWRAVNILAAALLVSGQQRAGDKTTLDIPNPNAPIGGGSYGYMRPQGNAAGELPRFAEFVLFPPQRWGRTTCMVDDTIGFSTATRRQNCDHVLIDFVSITTIPPNAPNDEKTWAPFNQYPRTPWENMNWRFAGFDSADMFQHTAQVSSSPPCLFTAVVLKGGRSILLVVEDCVLPRIDDLVIGGNTLPGTGTNAFWQSMFDVLTIYVPDTFLAINPTYGHSVVQTQATFFLANEVAANNVNGGPPSPVTVVGPFPANTPYYVQTIPLGLYVLQFLDFTPGNPAQGIKANTIAGSKIDTMTVGVFLGQQLQAGMKIVISVSVGPVDIFGPDTDPNRAPPQAFPSTASGQLGLIWNVPSNVPANTAIVLGPGCGRPGSVHCCSQSFGEVLVPQVSVISYPEWIVTLSITLGPAGCVLPSNRRFSFAIPQGYLGKNPSQTITDAFNNQMPGFYALNAFMYTTAEPQLHYLRRHAGDISPLAYQQGYFYSSNGVNDNTADQVDRLLYNLDMPDQLADAVRMHQHDLIFGGGISSYVVGTSTFTSMTFKIDTAVAGTQPTKLEVSIKFNKGLSRLVDAAGNRRPLTPYVIALYFTTAVVRPNVATLANPLSLAASTPAKCDNELKVLTTATGNMLIWFENDNCISSLTSDGSVLTFTIPESLLYRIVGAAWSVSVDAHLIPPMFSLTSVPQFGVAIAGLDTAALMGVPVFTSTLDCSTLPTNVNDIYALSVASRCVMVDAIVRTSIIGAGFVQCPTGGNVNNANAFITYVKFTEANLNGVNYPGINAPPPASNWPQNVGLPGTPPVYVTNYGIMWTNVMIAVIVSYPPTAQNLQSLAVNPVVPSSYRLAFIVRITRITTACSVVTEANPWAFCVVVSGPVVNPLYFPAVNPVPAGSALDTMTFGRLNGANVACFLTLGDGAVAAWYPLGVSPIDDDESDGAWYAFFAFFALPLLLLCCCLLALLLFLKRKPKTCCPQQMEPYPVQEQYWVSAPVGNEIYAQQMAMPSPIYMVQ